MNKITAKNNLKNIAILLLIAIFFMFDRYFKALALNNPQPLPLIGKIFSFEFAANYFMAFSLPLGGRLLSIIIGLIIIILLITIFYLIFKRKNYKIEALLLTLILFGAISNIIDRLAYGYVIDYFKLKYFTIFNLADAMISFGALILIIKNLRNKQYA